MSRYEYRILKSTWGIAIDIDATHKVLDNLPTKGEQISTNLWLELTNVILTSEEKDWIVKGLEIVNKKIISDFDSSKYILIDVTEVEYFPCDYQSDGLACAIMGWASKEFNFSLPNIDIEFDKRLNRYNINLESL